MYLAKLPNLFVEIAKYICPNCQIYLYKLPNIFVQELCGDYIMSPKFVSRTSPPTLSPHKLSFVRGNPIDQKLFHPRDRKENIFSLGKGNTGLSRGEIQNKRRPTCLGQMSPKFASDVTF